MRKIVSHNVYFVVEIIVGLVTVSAAIVFGAKGWAVFALYGMTAFLKRKKTDERELQLILKAHTGTMISVYLSMFPVYFLLPYINWLMAMACSFIFFHGLWGLLMFRFG
jgi:hypothetical protein